MNKHRFLPVECSKFVLSASSLKGLLWQCWKRVWHETLENGYWSLPVVRGWLNQGLRSIPVWLSQSDGSSGKVVSGPELNIPITSAFLEKKHFPVLVGLLEGVQAINTF